MKLPVNSLPYTFSELYFQIQVLLNKAIRHKCITSTMSKHGATTLTKVKKYGECSKNISVLVLKCIEAHFCNLAL